MQNRQPLFMGPAAQTIRNISKAIFMQTPGDQHQVQQHCKRGDGAAEVRRKYLSDQRRTGSNHQAHQGEELDCTRQAVGRERHRWYRQTREKLKGYRDITANRGARQLMQWLR